MRRILIATVVASTALLGMPVAASAGPRPAPAASALPPGWSLDKQTLTWTSDRIVPPGDAAVEFWAGDRLLGRATGSSDLRKFSLPVGSSSLAGLQVRIGGKRADVPAPRRLAKTAPAATLPPLPAGSFDPGVKGPYATTTGEYSLPGVRLSAYPAKVEMQAVVVAPKNAPGKRPLALFLHGRHGTCYTGPGEEDVLLDWPCPAGSKSIPSYRGYLQAQQLLASQGYITVSISANGINAQDNADDDGGAQARSSLVRMHLADWADWAGGGHAKAPTIVRAAPRADMSKVFLMGHSRGGEGVSRAAMDSITPPPAAQDDYHGKVRWTIRGLLLIGPTAFGQNPQPDVPSATILPGCDGDVSDLEGQMYVDATRGVGSGRALHSALYVIGADHNFFNTEWTPGQAVAPASDDFFNDPDDPDPLCTPGVAPTRLTATQQQTVGATYIATAARLFVGGDDRARPLLDGSGVRPRSTGPARVLSAALGGNRTPAILPGPATVVHNARTCDQVPSDDDAAACISPEISGGSPNFVPFTYPEPGRYAVELNGTAPATIQPAAPMPVAGSTALAMRVIVPANAPATSFHVVVTDDQGHRTDLRSARITGLAGTDWTMSYWAQEVRLPLPATVRSIAKLEITPASGSPMWLVDAWGWRPGTPAPGPSATDRVDVGTMTVDEGDSGTRTYSVPVKVRGHRAAQVRLFFNDYRSTDPTKTWVADIEPGDTRINVPVTVTGNTIYDGGQGYSLEAKAVRGAVVGSYTGGLQVHEDDPMPTVTVTPAAVTAPEGTPLTWTVHLSEAAGTEIYVQFQVEAPATGPELSTTDVDPDWFRENSFEDPEPSRPLSSVFLFTSAVVEPGETSAQFTVPTVADGVTEGPEHVRFEAQVYPDDFGDPITVATIDGTVTD